MRKIKLFIQKHRKVIVATVSISICVIIGIFLFSINASAAFNKWSDVIYNEKIDNLRNKQYYDLKSVIAIWSANQTVNDGYIAEHNGGSYHNVVINPSNATNQIQFDLIDSRVMLCRKLLVKPGQKISFIAAKKDTADAGGDNLTNGKSFYMCINEFDANGNIVSDGNWLPISDTYTIGQTAAWWPSNSKPRTNVKYILPTFRYNKSDAASGAGLKDTITPKNIETTFSIFRIYMQPFNYTFKLNSGIVQGKSDNLSVSRLGATTVSIPATPSRTGYNFSGWKITSTEGLQTGKTYTADQLKVMFSDSKYYSSLFTDTVFEAQWTENRHTISFHANGGTGTVNSLSVQDGYRYNMANNQFTRDGYTFAGWNSQADGKGAEWRHVNDSVTCTADKTWYAQWQVADWFVTYHGNGAETGQDWFIANRAAWVNEKYKENYHFLKNGYAFCNWKDSLGKLHNVGEETGKHIGTTVIQSSLDSNYCITETGDGVSDGISLISGKTVPKGSTDQKWSFVYAGTFDNERYWFIVDTSNGKRITEYAGGAVYLFRPISNTEGTQLWTLETTVNSKGKTAYRIKNKQNGQYLYTGGGTANGGIIQTYPDREGDIEKWELPSLSMSLDANWVHADYMTTYRKDADTMPGSDCILKSYDASIKTNRLESAALFSKTGYTFSNWKNEITGDTYDAGSIFSGKGFMTTIGSYIDNNYVATVIGNSTLNNQTVSNRKLANDYQYWHFVYDKSVNSQPYWRIQNRITGKCLTVYKSNLDVCSADAIPNDESQLWTLKYAGNGYYYVSSLMKDSSGKEIYANLEYCRLEGNIHMHSFTGGPEQKWKLDGISSYYTAEWSANEYNIKFNANGATGSMDDLVCKYDTAYNLPQNAFIRPGWGFSGWNTNADGSGQSYVDKASIKNLTAEDGTTITLYAQWNQQITKVVINHYLMNTDGSYPAMPTNTSELNAQISVSIPIGKCIDNSLLVDKGVEYDHATVNNITKEEFAPTDGTVVNIYYRRVKHKVILNTTLNGGHWADHVTDDRILEYCYGADVYLDDFAGLKEGWQFIGWNLDNNANSGIDSIKMGTDDVTVYALYKKQITATFVDVSGTRKESVTLLNNNSTGTIQTLDISSYVGYQVIGWNTHKTITDNGATKSEVPQNTNITLANDITYYAVYHKTVTLSYELNGGKSTDATNKVTASVYCNGYDPDQILGKEIQLPVCERDLYDDGAGTIHHYSLTAWAKDSNEGEQYAPSSIYALTDDTIMYAVWDEGTENVNYTVSYQANGVNVSNLPSPITVQYGDAFEISDVIPTRLGMTFVEWNTEAGGGGVSYQSGQQVKNLTAVRGGVIELYAQWKSQKFKVVKASSKRYQTTLVKRMPGDEEWYNRSGKLSVKELLTLEEKSAIQVWNINQTGTITRID